MAESRAAVVTGYGQPLEMQSLPIPELEPAGLLVRVDAATLCGTDVHYWHGSGGMGADALPYIPGHETAGTIVDIRGQRVDILGQPLKEGDRIICAYALCGHCFFCTVARQPNLCRGSIYWGRTRSDRSPYLLGGCAEYQYFPPGGDVIRVPEEVSSPLAASAACALRTVIHGFERLGPLASHETVLVQGCGPLGLYALAMAKDRGARRVLVIGAPAERLKVALEWGADAVLDLDEYPDPVARKEWVLEQTAGLGPDVGIQVANSAAIAEGLDLMRRGGRYISIGATGGEISIPGALLSVKYLTIMGVIGAEGRQFHQALDFLATRRHIPFERLISNSYPLERTSEAMQAMAEFREVKPVILPNGA